MSDARIDAALNASPGSAGDYQRATLVVLEAEADRLARQDAGALA